MNFPPATTVDLLRHGEPAGGRKFRGSVDDPLSELGWQQMRAATQAAENAGEATWDQVISSPLLRSGEFASELATQRGLPIEVWSDVREMHCLQVMCKKMDTGNLSATPKLFAPLSIDV